MRQMKLAGNRCVPSSRKPADSKAAQADAGSPGAQPVCMPLPESTTTLTPSLEEQVAAAAGVAMTPPAARSAAIARGGPSRAWRSCVMTS